MQTVLSDVHRKFVATRRMQNLVDTKKFEEAYSRSTDADRVELDVIVEACDPDALTQWIGAKLTSYDDMTKSDLRFRAMVKRVKYYSRKSKEELIQILKELDNEEGKGNRGNSN